METPKTLQACIQHFSDPENCRKFMVGVRWLDGVVRCPYCNSDKVTYLATAKLYRCYGDHPKQKFSLKVGTVFEDSPIPLEKWLPAVWLVVNCKNGISSYEIHRALGVTQKSAWFMLHRIRLAVRAKSFDKMGGPGSEVEVDETFIGGKARNMHKEKRIRMMNKLGDSTFIGRDRPGNLPGKVSVHGILDRESRMIRATVVPNIKRATLQQAVLDNVHAASSVYTDQSAAYDNLRKHNYTHEVVNHLQEYVRGKVHTNGMENFWSLLKRPEWYLCGRGTISPVPLRR